MANIDVYSGSEKIGRIQKTKSKHLYAYDLDAHHAVSLTMPVRLKSYEYESLHPFFQMNMPEGILRSAIEKATAKQFGSDDLTVLALLGNNQIGSVRYALEGKPLRPDDGQPLALDALLSSNDASLFSQLLARFSMRSGVAGVQPKVLMDLENRANSHEKVTYPLGAYIVKSWGTEYPELACNEFICLTLAKEAGLETSPFYLSDNGKLLITKRFDLDANANPIGFEDFCVLQGKSTRQKYDASLESCANTINQFISVEQRQKALYDFFKLTLINVCIRNGDAHLKNYGVLYDNLQDYTLGAFPQCKIAFSPVFDIVSTVPYLPNDTMALSLTGSKRWPKWKVLYQFATQHCGLSRKKIEQIVQEVESAKSACLPVLQQLSEQHPEFKMIASDIHKFLVTKIEMH